MPNQNILREACVESLEQAIAAQNNGADRIELCGDLSVGGITPSYSLVVDTYAALDIPIKVMIRPRGGVFVYNEEELAIMLDQIAKMKSLRVDGIVLGCLTANGNIDVNQLKLLSIAAGSLPITFHKAIDEVKDWKTAFDQFLAFENLTHILTSGQKNTAEEGVDTLKEMIDLGQDRLTIVAAGSITRYNLRELHEKIGGKEYHGRKIVAL